jgi:hypothetical protein
MTRMASYQYCVIGSGTIINRLLKESHFLGGSILIVSDQMSMQNSGELHFRQIVVQTRKQFTDSKNQISVKTLIISAKTNLWPNDYELDLLLHKAHQSGVSRVILFSSGSVYGESIGFSNEDSRLEPVNTYGRHKLLEEIKTVDTFRGRAQILVLRISNVYGDRRFDDVVNRCIKSIKEGTPLTVYSGGTLTRDFIYVEDLTKILGCLIDNDLSSELEYLNLSSGKTVSIMDLVELISDILATEIERRDVSRPRDVVKDSVLDNLKLNERFSPRLHTLEEGLTKYICSQFPELTKHM